MEVLDVSGTVEGFLGDWLCGGGRSVDEFGSRLCGGEGFLCLGGSAFSCAFPSSANFAPVGVRVDVSSAAFADFPRAGDSAGVSPADPVVVTVSATVAPVIPRQPGASAFVAGFRIRQRHRPLIAGTAPLVVPVGANPASTSAFLDRCSAAGTGIHYDSFPS